MAKKVKFTLEHVTKAQTGSRGIALLFDNLGATCGWVYNATPRPLYPREEDPVPIEQEAGSVPGPVWTAAENFTEHRDSIPGPSSLYEVAISGNEDIPECVCTNSVRSISYCLQNTIWSWRTRHWQFEVFEIAVSTPRQTQG